MNKLIDKNTYNEEIFLLLDTYYFELNYYKKKLKIIEKHKPFFFEINSLKEYNKEKKYIENKINLYENKIADLINNH